MPYKPLQLLRWYIFITIHDGSPLWFHFLGNLGGDFVMGGIFGIARCKTLWDLLACYNSAYNP